MSRASELFFLIALFVLRLGVPVAFTLAVCFLLRRLDRKWEEEAQLGAVSAEAAGDGEAPSDTATSLPCWLIKGCGPERYENCAAYHNRALPCWLARLRAEGRIPQPCSSCSLFRTPAGSHA
jgi:hypothetical protein